ncbi:EamA family transporter [Clostridium sp. P21]|uniref:EamA family transporter n=1 Tax=Clostridium muellerianum TaxID=2716538 RepID=A0A7Y0EIV8_9CLOT|nr:EamA family transporter [Clostridium muellerianum]NMM64294.1 EamA family transporter [Clostridium muellerianum]
MTNKKTAYVYLIITFCAWGSLYVVSKFVLGKVPVVTVLFLRYFIAGITLFFMNKKSKAKKIEREDLKYIFLVGFAGYFLSVGAQLIGIKLSNASIASLINAMNPITMMFFAAVILKERLTIKKVFCVVLAMLGVYITIGDVRGNGQALGILFSIFSVILWSLVSVMVRRITQKYGALQITTYSMFIATLCTLPISIGELIVTPNVQFNWSVILSLIYMGIVCTALAYVLWNKSLSIIEAGTCSLFYPVQPMVSVIFGVMFLGEHINMNFIFGAVLIVGGVLFSILGKKSTSKLTKQACSH